ncbi:MAG: hypothetical protein LBM66_05075 [Bifidobacteriaceae bacterium]|jgi:hypothetical protein|nr:hypothetical protein [Bifidobacteriaceae bacterium]
MSPRPSRILAALTCALAAISLAACSGGSKAISTPSVGDESASQTASAKPSATSSASAAAALQADAVKAATWLSTTLKDSNHEVSTSGGSTYDDPGLTIDTLWAMVAANQVDQTSQIGAWLADKAQIKSYTGQGAKAIYAAATAKLGLALGTPGLPAETDFDASALLTGRLQSSGRFTDSSSSGDYSTPTGQALAILYYLQQGTLASLHADPVQYLVGAQCKDGSWPASFDAGGASASASADADYSDSDSDGDTDFDSDSGQDTGTDFGADDDSTSTDLDSGTDTDETASATSCVGDVDTTGLVVQALAAAGGQPKDVLSGAVWLAHHQSEDGSWSSSSASAGSSVSPAASASSSGKTASVNSTAMAVMGLLSAYKVVKDDRKAIQKAALAGREFLASVQNSDGGLPVGASGTSDARATAQGVVALEGDDMPTLLGVEYAPTASPSVSASPSPSYGYGYRSTYGVGSGSLSKDSGR